MKYFVSKWQIDPHNDDNLEINVIPLIDILLVVLIFITATTTFSKIEQIELTLPQTTQEEMATQGHVLIITHEGQYALNGRLLANDIESLTQALNNLEHKEELLIYADANTRHAHVVNALDAAKNALIEHVHFAAEKNIQ